MRILWICNVPNIEATQMFGLNPLNVGGWLTGLSMSISEENDIELFYAFPLTNIKEVRYESSDLITYIAIPKRIKKAEKYDKNYEIYFEYISHKIKPDIVHIFGTEYPHSLSASKIFKNTRTVISIQGMTSVYSNHYLSALPLKLLNRKTLIELIKNDSILRQQGKLATRGRFENQTIKNTKYIIGRTDWDNACTYFINPNRHYFHCNETLRNAFYSDKWSINNIDRHSIFFSQATSPIKGLHLLIEAMLLIKNKYPNVKIYVSGSNILKKRRFGILFNRTYPNYISKKITMYKLNNNIEFIGSIDEYQMKNRFLKSNVFVSCSSIENSPNSLGEAMILGVPCISSFVGGVPSMLEHGKEGLLYQYDAPYMLAYYIDKIFSDDLLAIKLSKNAIDRAEITHNKQTNAKSLVSIYNEILNNDKI